MSTGYRPEKFFGYRWVLGTSQKNFWVPMGTGYRPEKKFLGTDGYRVTARKKFSGTDGYRVPVRKKFLGTDGYQIFNDADRCPNW